MGETTAIAWTDHSFNGWWGCTKIAGPGGTPSACDHCYAADLAKRFGHNVWGKDAPRRFFGDKHWQEPLKWNRESERDATTGEGLGRRHRVFCASMGDVFEDRRDLDAERVRLFELIEATPWLDWQLLTKRPEQMARLAPPSWADGWPPNAWAGTTVEDERCADLRIPRLLAVPAAVRFLSCEPLFGPIDLGIADHRGHEREYDGAYNYVCLDCSTEESQVRWFVYDEPTSIQWVICGGESGPHHRPLDLNAARSLRDQCATAGVPFFFKQVGGRTPTAGGDEIDGERIKQFPESRQP